MSNRDVVASQDYWGESHYSKIVILLGWGKTHGNNA